MLGNHPFRHVGPRVFISYSYLDRTLADRLQEILMAKGFQVRKEDETSLLGHNLRESLPRRIRDSEVFIQLLTTTSAASAWISREFEWAIQAAREGSFMVLPVVVGEAKPSAEISDWGYVGAPDGLTDHVIDLVSRTSASAVESLPLDMDAVFTFASDDVTRVLKAVPDGLRRIVSASEGFPLDMADDAVRWAEEPSGEPFEPFVAQERRRRERISRLLGHADLVLPRMFEELHRHLSDYASDYPARAVEAVNRFTRLLLGKELIACWDTFGDRVPSLRPHTARFEAAKQVIEEGQSQRRWDPEFGLRHWALGTRPSDGSSDYEDVGFDGVEGKRPAILFFPVTAIGSDWQLILQMTENPTAIIQPYDWADFGIPQVAVRAAYALNSPGPPADVIDWHGWALSDYRRMGLP
jgi:hypothetical protein